MHVVLNMVTGPCVNKGEVVRNPMALIHQTLSLPAAITKTHNRSKCAQSMHAMPNQLLAVWGPGGVNTCYKVVK